MGECAATSRGQAAILAALRAYGAQGPRHTPWMQAAALAHAVGSADQYDPQFQADVQALHDAGAVRLMAGGDASGRGFYEAMLAPLGEPPEAPPG